MDDGLPASIILTRSVHTTTKWVREQRVRSLLAADDEVSRVASMKGRLRGAPNFNPSFIADALHALSNLSPLCVDEYQRELYTVLKDAFAKLGDGAVACK